MLLSHRNATAAAGPPSMLLLFLFHTKIHSVENEPKTQKNCFLKVFVVVLMIIEQLLNLRLRRRRCLKDSNVLVGRIELITK